PCVYIDCPEGLKCYRGQCVKPEDIPVVIYDPNIGADAGTDAGKDTTRPDTSSNPDTGNSEYDAGISEYDDTDFTTEVGFNPSAFDRETSGSCSCSHLF
ncbi:MAG: hypothetical protein N3B13_10675, partial [Deltaproteobacteria bacterium]|nr:hypothetical protein [Deltaproteobacteria bacterium]